MARQRAYFGLSWVVSLILAIIPITSWVCGIVVRAQRQNWLGLILTIIPITFPVMWIIDIITMIMHKDLTILA